MKRIVIYFILFSFVIGAIDKHCFAANGPDCPSGVCIGPGTSIDDAATHTITANAYYTSMTIKNGGVLTIRNGATLYVGAVGTLATTSVVDFQNGSVILIEAGGKLVVNGLLNNSNNSDNISINGSIQVNGNVTLGNNSAIAGTGSVSSTGSTTGGGSIFGGTPSCSVGPCNTSTSCSSLSNTISSSQTICTSSSPSTLTGNAIAGASYQWAKSTTSSTVGFSDISGATGQNYSPGAHTQTTYYIRKATTNNGICLYTSNAVTITVSAASVSITTQPANAIVCSGGPAILNVVAAGPNLSYQWQSYLFLTGWSNMTEGSIGTGVATNTVTIPNPGSYPLHSFRVVVTSNCGTSASSTSNSVTISNGTGPSITTQPNTTNRVYCPGAAATALNVNLIALVSYQWYRNTTATTSGGTPVGTNSNTYTPLTTTPGVFYYYVVATNLSGCSTTSNVSGSYTIRPLTSITPSAVPTLCEGATFALGGSPSGGTWVSSTPARVSVGLSTGILTAGSSNNSATITYTDPNTCTASITVEASQTDATPQTITGANSICSNTTSSYSATTSGGTWTSSNTSVAIVNSTTGVVSGVSAGSVSINYAVATGGCNSSTTKAITINASPTVSAGIPLPATCQASTTSSLGGSYGGGATSAVWSSSVSGGSFANNTGSTPATATYTVPTAATGTITLTLTTSGGSCGTTTATKSLTVNTLSTAPTAITGAVPICLGNSTTLGATGGSLGTGASSAYYQSNFVQEWITQPYGFYTTTVNSSGGVLNVTSTSNDPHFHMNGLGSFDPTINRYITIRYRVTSGTAGTAEIFFYNAAHPAATGGYSVSGALVSDNTWRTLQLDMSSNSNWTESNVTGWRFDWCSGNTVTMDIDYIMLWGKQVSATVSPSSTTNYFVVNEGTCNVTQNVSGTVAVNALPVVSFSANPVATVCSGTSVTYTTQSGQNNYVWSVPGVAATDYTIISGDIGNTSNTVTLQWLTAGSKTVTVNYSNSNGCTATTAASTTSTINLIPTVSAGSALSATCQAATTVALGGSYGGGATSAVWSSSVSGGSFANNTGSTPATATYTVPTAATGTITLTLTTSGGSCGTTTATKSLTVNTLSTAPTAITGAVPICLGNSTTLGSTGGSLGTGASSAYYQSNFVQEWITQPYGFYTTTVNSSGGVLNVTSTSNDPHFHMNGLGSFDPTINRYITIRYRVTSGTAGTAEIFFYNAAHPAATGGYSVSGALVSDNTWRTLQLDMSSNSNWTESNVTGWRFDYCSGNTVTMDIDYIMLWGKQAITTVSPASTTNYFVVNEGTCNVTSSAMGTVTVNPLPTVNVGSAMTAICQGGTSAALGGSYGGAATSAVWSAPSGTFNNNGGTTPNTATFTAAAGSTSPITLTLTTSGGSCGATSSTKDITVNALPSISIHPSSFVKCAGDNVTFSVTATGTNLTYQWKKDLGNIASATSSTYAIPTITTAHVGSYTVVVSGTCSPSATSNAATLSVGTAITWSGATSNDWHVASNWSCGIVPNSGLDATVSAVIAPYPTIGTGATASVKSISLASGTSLTMSPSSVLNVYGNWNNAGTFNAGAGTVDFKGSSQTITKTGSSTKESFYGLTKSTSGTLTVGASTDIDILPGGTLLVSSGSFDLNNRPLVLKSWAPYSYNGHLYDSTARLGQVGGTLLNSGNFAIERYIATPINPINGRSYVKQRFVATPVTGMAAQQWADSVSIYGGPVGTGFIQRSSSIASVSTLQWYSEPNNSNGNINIGFRSVTARSEVLPVGKGYALSVGFDGSPTTTLYPAARLHVVLKMRGAPTTGAFGYPITKSGSDPYGWNLVGNPYPGEIDWDLVRPLNPGVSSTVVQLDPLGGVNSGQYYYYNQRTGRSIDPRYTIDSVAATTTRANRSLIASGQGFFVFSTVAGTSSLQFTEAVKPSVKATPVANFREEGVGAVVNIGVGNGTLNDNAYVFVDGAAATRVFDADFDAYKMSNSQLSVSTSSFGRDMAMNGVSPDGGVDVPVTVWSSAKGVYSVKVALEEGVLPGGGRLYLKDSETGSLTELVPGSVVTVPVELSANSSTKRFSITSNTSILTGADKNEMLGSGIEIYPNPVLGDKLTVHMPKGNGTRQIEITDLNGVLLFSKAVQATETSYVVTNLPEILSAGVYTVKVSGEDGIKQQKFVYIK